MQNSNSTIITSWSNVSTIQVTTCNTSLLQQQVHNEDWFSQSLIIVVIGASGDLAKKKTYPSLYELYKNNLLPPTTRIKGFARTIYKTNQQFRSHIKQYLMKQQQQQQQQDNDRIGNEEELMIDNFLNICYYNHGTGYDDWESIQSLVLSSLRIPQTTTNLLIYLAVPPNVFGQVCNSIKQVLFPHNSSSSDTNSCIINGFYRIVLEKPFGNDSESCQQLINTLQYQNWYECTLYRIDHYLGKDIVQSIIPFRLSLSNRSNLWKNINNSNNNTIQYVHIVWKEPFGTNGRGGYFDSYGIIRDVLQNHLLQIITLLAMDLPENDNNNTNTNTADTIRDAKVNVLSNIQPITIDDVLLGQYDGYTTDSTILNKETTTPTYAAIKLTINNMPQWYNVPFIIEAGKALDEHLCEVRIQFCNTITGTSTTTNHNNHNRNSVSTSTNSNNNTLVFRIQPNPTIYFTGDTTLPISTKFDMKTSFNTTTTTTNTISDAYSKLILECLRGQQHNFVRDDELILSWKIFTPLLHTIENNVKLYIPYQYKQGSTGPIERKQFLYTKLGISANNNNTYNRNRIVPPPSIVSSL